MKKKSSPGLVLLRYFSGILAALILFIALANFIAGGGLFSTILLIDQIHYNIKEKIRNQALSDRRSFTSFVLFRDLIFKCSFRR